MRKSTIFISAVLTTFTLVMLYQVASAYNDNKVSALAAAEPTATPEAAATEPPEPTEVVLGPEEAARMAAQVVNNANLLSAETSNFNGIPAYLITFSNQDVVYVGLDGQILAVQVAPVVVNAPAPQAKKKNKDNGNKKRNNNASGGNNQGGGEDHDDDDD